MIGQMAEWSKALESGSSLSGGVGSNPTLLIFGGHSRHFLVYSDYTVCGKYV